MTRVLYVIACAAPPAQNIDQMIRLAHEEGWDACLLATPSALRFFDPAALRGLTGHPVRSQYKEPGTPDSLPEPDAIIVAPATVNTINKWALGICDTLPLGILVEAIGKKLPVAALPFTNYAHAAHPAFPDSVARLRSWGVQVLLGPDVYPLHAPGTGGQHINAFPWALTLQALNSQPHR
ncbi:MAG TPA: flavoprotein [Streptosporangiaceae bacterium]|nr:flavoprotein [Streptosporangiaceae bacterium]